MKHINILILSCLLLLILMGLSQCQRERDIRQTLRIHAIRADTYIKVSDGRETLEDTQFKVIQMHLDSIEERINEHLKNMKERNQ